MNTAMMVRLPSTAGVCPTRRCTPTRCASSSSGASSNTRSRSRFKQQGVAARPTQGRNGTLNAPAPIAPTSSRDTRAFDCADADTPCVIPPQGALPADGNFQDDLDSIIEMLPDDVRDALMSHEHRNHLLEVVLDLGRCPEARFAGNLPCQCLRLAPVTQADLDAAEEAVGDFGGDNRAGIQGTLHRISCMRNRRGKIVGLTCRVGRAVTGHVDMINDLLASSESILFLGRPGVGKTTVIREMARVLSDEMGKRVVIIDTSNEIGGDGDVPHPAIGGARRMQVPDPSEQHRVMIEAVENHTPEVIIVDEIGTEAEALACRTIAERGVQLVGTAHGQLLENLIKNPTLTDLVGGVQAVTLGDDEARARGCQKSIMERQAPPTFPVLIEMHERSLWVAHNVEESVDEVLQGGRPMVQVRSRDEATGEVVINRTVYDMDVCLAQKNVAYTLGSMGGVMAATAKMETLGIDPSASVGAAANNISPPPGVGAGGGGYGREGSGASGFSGAGSWSGSGSGLGDDPYAWAHNLGRVPDKDALALMEAGYGYLADGGNSVRGGTDKRGNGKKEKKSRLRAQR